MNTLVNNGAQLVQYSLTNRQPVNSLICADVPLRNCSLTLMLSVVRLRFNQGTVSTSMVYVLVYGVGMQHSG